MNTKSFITAFLIVGAFSLILGPFMYADYISKRNYLEEVQYPFGKADNNEYIYVITHTDNDQYIKLDGPGDNSEKVYAIPLVGNFQLTNCNTKTGECVYLEIPKYTEPGILVIWPTDEINSDVDEIENLSGTYTWYWAHNVAYYFATCFINRWHELCEIHY